MTKLNGAIDFAFLVDVKNGNPNGDIDNGNLPRQDHDSGLGLWSDVSIKRRVRDYMELAGKVGGWDVGGIYVAEPSGLPEGHLDSQFDTVDFLPMPKGKTKSDAEERKACADENTRRFLRSFVDVRLFGAVIPKVGEKSGVAAAINGPVQIGIGESLHPVDPMDMAVSRVAQQTAKEAEKAAKDDDDEGGESRRTGTIGRKQFIPYGLYLFKGSVSPANAYGYTSDAGAEVSAEDVDRFFDALANMWGVVGTSASRGEQNIRLLVRLDHESPLRSAPRTIMDGLLSAELVDGVSVPRSHRDYDVRVNTDGLPSGVVPKIYVNSWNS